MPYGYALEATYESGFVYRENPEDHSYYCMGRNCFFDILHHKPTECGHGRLTTFAMVRLEPDEDGRHRRWEIDWTSMPDEAQPVHAMRMQRAMSILGPEEGDTGPYCTFRVFGCRVPDPDKGGELVNDVVIIDNDTGDPVDPESIPYPVI